MFDNEYHQLINLVLTSLDPMIFQDSGAYFGGGTLISLLNDEFRWSKDIDFICPVGPGYRNLRSIVFNSNHKPEVLFKSTQGLGFPRELTANQYGIRFLVMANETPIKFEVVAENRIELNPPEFFNWPNLPCLGFDDQCTEKLLANSDRWLDSSVESRDLIDLAILRLRQKFNATAIEKAEKAQPSIEPLVRSINNFLNKDRYREKCLNALKIKNPSSVIEGVSLLAKDFQ